MEKANLPRRYYYTNSILRYAFILLYIFVLLPQIFISYIFSSELFIVSAILSSIIFLQIISICSVFRKRIYSITGLLLNHEGITIDYSRNSRFIPWDNIIDISYLPGKHSVMEKMKVEYVKSKRVKEIIVPTYLFCNSREVQSKLFEYGEFYKTK